MEVLILGGTGAMGIPLVRMLSKVANIYVTSRSSRISENTRIHYMHGNALSDDDFINNLLLKEYDAIVDFMIYPTDLFKRRTELFLNSTNHYIFISSSRVYADCECINENSPRLLDIINDSEYLATDEYALKKARQENIIFDSKGDNWTIVRPYITYNSERLQFGFYEKEAWLQRALKGHGVLFPLSMVEKKTTLTSGEDVAKILFDVIYHGKCKGDIINPVSGKDYTWNQVFDIYAQTIYQLTGNRTTLIPIADEIIYNKKKGQKYQIIYDRLYNRVFDNKKVYTISNIERFTSLEEGLSTSLRNNVVNDLGVKFTDFKWEGISDKYTRDWYSLSEIGTLKEKLLYTIYRCL